MRVNADLHIHSRFSGGTSKNMKFSPISKESRKKGIQLVATGDCLHAGWMKEIREMEEIDEGIFQLNDTKFVLTTEVEDSRRVHHLLIFPSASSAEDFRAKITSFSPNLDSDGRPNLKLGGEEIAQFAKDVDALIGPCHAFTPWTALYAYHDSLKSCYGDLVGYISFVELGLSADTDYADRIAELERLTFLTNSDAHSPYPFRLAREFNRFEMSDITYEELKKAILRKGRRRAVLNVGLPPQEGKYNESACIKCYTHYGLREAIMQKWRCRKCGGRVKKGVKDRVNEIATYDVPKHPSHRPEYQHLVPLAEIITKAIGQSSPHTKTVFKIWNELITVFGDEIKVLVDADIETIAKSTQKNVTDAIRAFRDGKIILHPGGGGQYGRVELPGDMDGPLEKPIKPHKKARIGQTSLSEF